MTRNERKRQVKRKWKRLKADAYKKRKSIFRVILLILAGILLIILLASAVSAIRTHMQEAAAKRAAEEAARKEQEMLALTPTPTATPTPKPTVSISDGTLEKKVESMISGRQGIWSVYLKNLDTGESFTIDSQSMYAASLIKLFVLEDVYNHLSSVIENASQVIGSESEAYTYVNELLSSMITVSDNDAYNTLVSLRSSDDSFYEGCLSVNEDIQAMGYDGTGIYSSLVPADLEFISTAEGDEINHTTVEDCGTILEKIYNGTCVSQAASEQMLEFLLNQETTYKIPDGVPKGIKVANKTGDTDDSQHDAAIVYGETTDYILCVMSSELTDSGEAMDIIQNISRVVYDYLNP